MLSLEQINEIAIKMQTSVINVAREYVQNVFLNAFYSLEKSDSILFKGGTALRILYRSPRFSEDLDFSAKSAPQNTIEDLLQETLLLLDREGINVDLKESTSTSGGFLGIIHSQIQRLGFNISIEISTRKKKISDQIVVVENPYIESYSIVALKKEELINEKIEALVTRKKPRDFFDLYFMLRANLVPEKSVLKTIAPLVAKTRIDFKKELLEFLPKSHHKIIKDFKKYLEIEIERFLP